VGALLATRDRPGVLLHGARLCRAQPLTLALAGGAGGDAGAYWRQHPMGLQHHTLADECAKSAARPGLRGRAGTAHAYLLNLELRRRRGGRRWLGAAHAGVGGSDGLHSTRWSADAAAVARAEPRTKNREPRTAYGSSRAGAVASVLGSTILGST